MNTSPGHVVFCICLALHVEIVQADEPIVLTPVEVRVESENLLGEAITGNEGIVSSQRLQAVPILRPGETLEMVPGLIVTQHAGDGKANQYFLRGFNLDHGTDFATHVGGVPVNMPTHAHGQGYTDLNFLIPELVNQIRFRKGPYYAEEGDFSSAGAAHIDYFRQIDGTLGLTLGEHGYVRSLLAGSPAVGNGKLLYAFEWFHNDGPWDIPENYRKLNSVLRYSQGTQEEGFSVTGMAYRGVWTSTDQIAQRAIDSGQINRFGTLDSTTGGETHRYSLSADWATWRESSQTRASAWWLKSELDLWSNFQYCLNDFSSTGTCDTGDQFKQAERRQAGGFTGSHTILGQWGRLDVENAMGVQGRIDRLNPVGLYATRARTILGTVRADDVTQRSLSLWLQNTTHWTTWLHTITGIRQDIYDFKVKSSLQANSGEASDRMTTPKLSLILGPWQRTEIYFNYGHGFHSNDARGTTIRVDPTDGVTPADRVNPLVRTKGYEIGLRSKPFTSWQTTVSVWQLDSSSELLFVGDAGITEASRPSRRHGVEWTNLYVPVSWLAFDADLAWSKARFRDTDPAGDYIPNAVTTTANLGITLDASGTWFASLRLRYFGARPLIEDNSVKSSASALTNLRLGYRIDKRTRVTLDVYNLFDREVNDIEYWYDSQLPGETAPAFDHHIHPTEPRSLRLSIAHRF